MKRKILSPREKMKAIMRILGMKLKWGMLVPIWKGSLDVKRILGRKKGKEVGKRKRGQGMMVMRIFKVEKMRIFRVEKTHGTDEENVAEDLSKMKNLGDGKVKEGDNPNDNEVEDLALGTKLSFLDTTKIKENSSLRGDS